MPRTAGAKNKFPQDAKENVVAVFVRLGGTAAMAEWAKKNLSDFYRIYAKLVPVEQHQQHSGDVNLTVVTGVPGPEQPRADS
jgi:hypothetical protein